VVAAAATQPIAMATFQATSESSSVLGVVANFASETLSTARPISGRIGFQPGAHFPSQSMWYPLRHMHSPLTQVEVVNPPFQQDLLK